MSRYGWAFVNSIVSGAAVIGPNRGVVLNEGGYASASANFQFSGSTGSLNGQLNVTGNVTINGTLYADTLIVSSSTIFKSGSTRFGDDVSDTHVFTGSLYNTTLVSGSTAQFTSLTGTSITASSIGGTTFDINGGAIDGTTIGASAQSSGKFTTLSASSTLDVAGNTIIAGNLTVNGNTTLGDLSTDIVTVTAQITGSQFDINGGTIDGTTIATSNITVGSTKTLDVSAGTLTLAAAQIGADKISGATFGAGTYSFAGRTITDLGSVTTADINGGTIDNTTIGVLTQSSGKFTTLSASSTLDIVGNTTLGGNLVVNGNITLGNAVTDTVTVTAQITGSLFDINGGTIDNTTIGATTQLAGKFTTLSASSNLDIGGNVVVAGNLTVSGAIELGNATSDQINVNGDLTVDDTTTLAGGVNYGVATVVAGTSYIPLAADSVIVLTSTSSPTVTLASQSTSRLLYILFQGGSGTPSVLSGSSSGIVDSTGTTSATVGMSTTARALTLLYNTNDNKYYVVAQT